MMATDKTLTRKAVALLELGDSLGRTNPAESRRILRKCLHFRRLAKVARKRESA